MARRAVKDTFGYEDVGGTSIRRSIFAGQPVPSQYGGFEDPSAVLDDGVPVVVDGVIGSDRGAVPPDLRGPSTRGPRAKD